MKNQYEVRGDIVVIFLKRKNGEVLETIIDTEDLEKANSFRNTWFAHWDKKKKSYYAQGIFYQKGKYKYTSLHRWLLNEPLGKEVDHINHDTLDNRRLSNLRAITHAENMQNYKGPYCDNLTGFRGVEWRKDNKKWRSRGKLNGKNINIGHFDNLEDAIKVRKEWELKNMPFSADGKKAS